MTTEIDFRLSPKQSRAIDFLEDDSTSELFYGGGAGSGKSYFGCYWVIKCMLMYPGARACIGRRTLKDLKESTLIKFWEVARLLHLQAGYHYKYNGQDHVIDFTNGSRIVLKDLAWKPSDPDCNFLGSTEYTVIFIDEAPEIHEKVFDVLNSRCRWMLDTYKRKPKVLLTGNPGDHWIKKKYIKDSKNVPVELKQYQQVVLATVEDNLNKSFADIYRTQLEKIKSDYDRMRLLHGDWDAMPRTGKEFYFNFVYEKHVGTPKYDPTLALHITYDFNVNPYPTLLVFQIKREKDYWQVNFLEEFCYEHPFNSTKAVTIAFREKYFKEMHHTQRLFYYGDYNGKNENGLGEEEIRHQYDQVTKILGRYLDSHSDRVIPNLMPSKRRDFIMECLDGTIAIRILLHENMTNTKKDFLYMKQGPDGNKFKQVARDTVTNTTFELFGHTSDAAEYGITSAFFDMLP